MSNIEETKKRAIATQVIRADLDPKVLEGVMLGGDLSKLTPQGRMVYYAKVCESVGLNPLTKPFDYIVLNGKLTLYARKDCTQQLCQINDIGTEVVRREQIGDIYIVTVRARKGSRCSDDDGAVNIAGLKGSDLANAMMKAITKAKRRAVLGICGLGVLDESEVETIEGAEIVPIDTLTQQAPEEKKEEAVKTDAPEIKESPDKPVSWLMTHKKGDSILEWRGLVVGINTRSFPGKDGKQKTITGYICEDTHGERVMVERWGDAHEGADGSICTFFEIKVGEFKGDLQFLASRVVTDAEGRAS